MPTLTHKALANLSKKLAYEGRLDLRVLTTTILRERRLGSVASTPFIHALRQYLVCLRNFDYPLELVQAAFPPTTRLSTSGAEFARFADELIDALTTEDHRVLFWYREKLTYLRVSFSIPFSPAPRVLTQARSDLIDSTRRQPKTTPPVRQDPSTSDSSPFNSDSTKESLMASQTFDLYDTESRGRVIFQYWVYDPATDDIFDEGSLICKGDTVAAATGELKNKLRVKLTALANPALRVHTKTLTVFTKPKDVTEDPIVSALANIAESLRPNKD